MTQRETELEHELAAALRNVDEQSKLLKLCKEENEEQRLDIIWTMGERAKLMEQVKQLKEDSKRFNWLLKTGLAWRGCYNVNWIEGEWLYSSQYTIAIIDKAKEAKP